MKTKARGKQGQQQPAKNEHGQIPGEKLRQGFSLIAQNREMARVYEENSKITSKYVHATAKGHEAIQIATGMQLLPQDYLSAYYRDDAMLLGIGVTPHELMLQLFAKKDDPFSGGRTYYSHPSLRREGMPKIPHQSSATGMQAIPATGMAMGIQYLENKGTYHGKPEEKPVVVCSLGDASVTEGEVAEAFQVAALKQLPILFLVQDNEWDISASADEVRAMNAAEYAMGFKGLETRSIEGNDFTQCYNTIQEVLGIIRDERRPFLVHAKVPLLNHHTSGVRMEFYRSEEDLAAHRLRDPYPIFKNQMIENGFKEQDIEKIEQEATLAVAIAFEKAKEAEEPSPESLFDHDFAPTPVTEESGERTPKDGEPTLMVDCALFAIQEIMESHPEALLYGQDVGGRLGGVFREAATLAQKFGDDRVFNTPIQEAFIIGSTVGMSAVGLKPFVEVQFADYIWPGLNQLFTEVSRSCYLSNGKWPVSSVIRVPTGAYGSGGPYHSSSVESVLLNIRGIKVVYPSNGADLKGLMKAAFLDPNPVVILEHKGLYWSKMKGTAEAKTIAPAKDYILPLGKARIALEADEDCVATGESLTVITYGMGVYWAKTAAKRFPGQIEVVDLRTLNPLDEATIFDAVKRHSRCLVLTEEPAYNTFAQGLAGRISKECFEQLDAPIEVMGSENLPAIPLNSVLEQAMLPNADKVADKLQQMLDY